MFGGGGEKKKRGNPKHTEALEAVGTAEAVREFGVMR